MRKIWSQSQDQFLRGIVEEVGLNDWTTVSSRLKNKSSNIFRSGKQCRERWYNHLNPEVNKKPWSYEESLLLFETHKLLGNRWKQISSKLKGRTDNNIKNHFYATLRRSLRRLNKMAGNKNSTHKMREIKPTILTIILNYIYDNQQENQNNTEFIAQLKDLPKLIFEFAQFKPIKKNMNHSLQDIYQNKIEIIFNLVQTFKNCFLQEKGQMQSQVKEQQISHSNCHQQMVFTQYKPQEKMVKVLINGNKQNQQNTSVKQQQIQSFNIDLEIENQQNLIAMHQPSPITDVNDLGVNGLINLRKNQCQSAKEGEKGDTLINNN